MTRRVRSLAAVLAGVAAIVAVTTAQAQRPDGRLFTYDQVFGAGQVPPAQRPSVLGTLPPVIGWVDDERYLELREDPDGQSRLYAVAAADGQAAVHRDWAVINKELPTWFDARRAAATTADLTGFVFQRDGDLFSFDLGARRFHRLTATRSEEQNPRFSPDGKRIAYTRDGNLYAYDLEGSIEIQLTSDGSDVVYNGWASWVFLEEILGRGTRYAAFWWSPDSAKLAFMRFDDTPVPVFPIYRADGQHGELERQRYPKAGDPNPWVSMGVATVADGKVVWLDFEEKADHYIAWPFWTPDSRTLTVQWMNRGQDTIRFYDCDPATGRKRQVFEQTQASWVDFFGDLHHFGSGSGFLLRSDVDGWDHLYSYGPNGALKTRLTAGAWRVASIALVDEPGGWVYFTGRPAGRTWNTQLMRVRLDGTGLQALTPDEGTHAVQVSPGGSYFIDTFSTLTTPAKMRLHRTDGTLVRELGDTRTAATGDYAWGRAELFTIPSGDGYDLPASWVLPPDFDERKSYPVIFSVYGGPDAGTVRNGWPPLSAHYWAQRGVITISVDHRASGHFGKKGVALMHRNLGKWEMHDLGKAVEWLRTKPFVAKDRIGITGGSYGGYTTLMALTAGAEHFNFGIAASSVSDWQLYDTVYTERYMDTPRENPEGYKNGAVLTYIDRYKGHLRITHGTIDDNVHMQNSMQVVDWLTSHNKPFELMLFPDSRHGIQASQRGFLNQGTHDFWVRNLLGGRLPPGGTATGAGGAAAR